ncbi:hypothetical protein EWF95_04300 [Halonotius roseus]|uniref:Uncharacterized protein n=1 Tax=Halonotius roseus TaxID=2511997 RepID=A0A544QST2_9EURY|nr:hypothetical protein EWF95_04300 [Halonotius roseus]
MAGCAGNGDGGSGGGGDGSAGGAANYVVTAETGAGSEGVPESAGFISACSASRRFVPGMQVVFYIGIFDPETGEQLTDEDLESVVVNVDGSESVELGWAGDDEENPADEWGGSYVLPEDIEPGTYSYTVEVTNGDANYQTVGILEDSFEVIEQANPTNYVVTTDTWWNNQAPEASVGFVEACGPERQFTQDMDVTFVIGVYNGSSGELVGNDTLDSVTIESTDGSFDAVDLEWQPGGEDSEPQWSGTLDTADLSTGSYSYEVTVTNGDANYHNVGIASNQFTIIEVEN